MSDQNVVTLLKQAREALMLCLTQLYHDGVMIEPKHPKRIAATAAEQATEGSQPVALTNEQLRKMWTLAGIEGRRAWAADMDGETNRHTFQLRAFANALASIQAQPAVQAQEAQEPYRWMYKCPSTGSEVYYNKREEWFVSGTITALYRAPVAPHLSQEGKSK